MPKMTPEERKMLKLTHKLYEEEDHLGVSMTPFHWFLCASAISFTLLNSDIHPEMTDQLNELQLFIESLVQDNYPYIKPVFDAGHDRSKDIISPPRAENLKKDEVKPDGKE